jgi:hypothetical protein
MEKLISYCFQPAKVACDERCEKAWGRNARPRIQLDPNDENTFMMLADHELGTAPVDPGTYEGGCGKPTSPEQRMNKWCIRECERCVISRVGESHLPLPTISFNERQPF